MGRKVEEEMFTFFLSLVLPLFLYDADTNFSISPSPLYPSLTGSWVAGPASDGPGSYLQKGDDISDQYLKAVMAGVEHLYGKKLGIQWLENLKLNKGLVDYR